MSALQHYLVLEWYGADESDYAIVGPFALEEHRDWFWTTYSAAEFSGWDNWRWEKVGEILGSYSGPIKSPMEFIETSPRNAAQLAAAQSRAEQLVTMGFEPTEAVRGMKIFEPRESPFRATAQASMKMWAHAVLEDANKVGPFRML